MVYSGSPGACRVFMTSTQRAPMSSSERGKDGSPCLKTNPEERCSSGKQEVTGAECTRLAAFFHPECAVGPGISAGHAPKVIAGWTAGGTWALRPTHSPECFDYSPTITDNRQTDNGVGPLCQVGSSCACAFPAHHAGQRQAAPISVSRPYGCLRISLRDQTDSPNA